jgi:hypothetical protein
MQQDGGFIVGVSDHCNRWCERCPLTSRCRLFADFASPDRTQDRAPAKQRRSPASGPSIRPRKILDPESFFDGDSSLSGDLSRLPADLEPATGVDPEVVANGHVMSKRLNRARCAANPTVRRAVATIEHFMFLAPLRMMQALTAVTQGDTPDLRSRANGTAKVAMLGLDEMERAWQRLVETRFVSLTLAAPFLAEIARLQRNLQRAVPRARDFVRPGLDEMDAVTMLDAAERMH